MQNILAKQVPSLACRYTLLSCGEPHRASLHHNPTPSLGCSPDTQPCLHTAPPTCRPGGTALPSSLAASSSSAHARLISRTPAGSAPQYSREHCGRRGGVDVGAELGQWLVGWVLRCS